MSDREQLVHNHSRSPILSSDARALYLKALNEDGRLSRGSCTPHEAAALDELMELGLLISDSDEPGSLFAADPAKLAASLSSTWQRQALDLLARAVAIPGDLGELAEAFHNPDQSGGPIEYVQGRALINQRVQQAMASGMTEGLAMQPGGPRPSELLTSFIQRDLDIIRHGASMRTIYNASTRHHQPTRDYVSTLAKEGWQFRTLDEPYTRLLIVDRRLAVIPVVGDHVAAFVHDSAVINYLAEEVFERNWSRALDFDGDRTIPQQVVSQLRHTIIDLLLAGTNHRVIARRLGISERTLARHIAEMREEHNVDSLFQLGYVLGQSSGTTA
ncbi:MULTISPECIES: helix-turn-helix domain-containing protein [unclassified Kitasatospora]|uniref:helix-turn-helix domain-containing protein n=1 Tax=unclassified Kitasatospora TaxID=2633591 RepID=UPI001ADFBE39|nr:helix-turn-helix domain-containing protein [Kitasatospora sp. RG8]MBP0453830.1 helix-turn-helix domain-containing protein [Kitasatospora sp. RG8]